MSIKYALKRIMPKMLYPYVINHQYRNSIGRNCNLNEPVAYTEKMQWCKLNRKDPILTRLSDKIRVREWVKERIGNEYLIPVIGQTYGNANEIDFDKLPDSFVIKANHGSGYNLVVEDKRKIDVDASKRELNKWLKQNYAFESYELQYKDIIPQLYIEEYIVPDGEMDLPDYKFFCFNGKVFCSYTMTDYVFDHKSGKLGFFDRDYNLMPYYRDDFKPITTQMPKPDNYHLMVELAEKLSQGFSHVRVDFYDIRGKIYFGEMTFTNASGYCKFVPDEFDYILGQQWDLSQGI